MSGLGGWAEAAERHQDMGVFIPGRRNYVNYPPHTTGSEKSLRAAFLSLVRLSGNLVVQHEASRWFSGPPNIGQEA